MFLSVPLPFLYLSTGVETKFTNGLDPEPRSRRMFAPHRPETIREWLQADILRQWVKGWPPMDLAAAEPSPAHLVQAHSSLGAQFATGRWSLLTFVPTVACARGWVCRRVKK
jgi:hypothetical protein